MATTIFFDGFFSAVPGSYSRIDASGLEQAGLSASGRVAILGTGVGGRPAASTTLDKGGVSRAWAVDDFIVLKKPQNVRSTFRSGDMREACAMVFEPSSDAAVPAGAREVVAMKVNQATQSTATLSNAIGDSLTIRSADWGAFTEQVNISVGAATNNARINSSQVGKLVTVKFETTTETADDLGLVDGAQTNQEAAMFELQYDEPTSAPFGWDRMVASVRSTGILAHGERDEGGLDGDIAAPAGGTVIITVLAAVDSAAMRGKTVTLYGVDASGDPIRETVTLDLTNANANPVATVLQFTEVFGAYVDLTSGSGVATDQAITIQNPTLTTLITVAAGDAYAGLVAASTMTVANQTVLLELDGAGTPSIQLWGLSANGAAQSEAVTMAGTTPVRTAKTWTQIDYIVLGDVAAARAATVYATAAETSNTVHDTLQKCADYFNARQVDVGVDTFGFTWTTRTGQTLLNPAKLDLTSISVDIDGSTGGFAAVLNAIEGFLDSTSTLTNAARIAFTRRVDTITFTGADAGTWDISIDGQTIAFVGDAADLPTHATNLAAAVNNTTVDVGGEPVHTYASASASGAAVTITSLTPKSATGAVTALVTNPGGAWNLAATTAQSGSGQPPANVTDQFLSGGSEGTATAADYQTALDLLKEIDVNTIVVLTGMPGVHSALNAHCIYMSGEGRSERDAFVGLSALDASNNPTNALPAKSSAKSQALSLNSRHIRACCQTIQRYSTAGDLTTFLPWFQGVIGAGMQAGSQVGVSLTRKVANVVALGQDSTWNPVDDAHEMIQAGLWFMEAHRTGRRCVRNITTYLQSTNLAFQEASVNEAANFAVFNFRNALDAIVGEPGFAGTMNAAKGVADSILDELRTQGIIVTYRALAVELNADIMDVSVEIAPIIPVNFVRSTVHLVTVSQTAA